MTSLTTMICRAKFIKRTLGTRCAAGYLRNRGVYLENALHVLARM